MGDPGLLDPPIEIGYQIQLTGSSPMIVCLCEGLNDKKLRAEIRGGARTLHDLKRSCGAGASCGSCVCDLKAMLAEHRQESDAAPQDVLSK